VSFPCRLTIRNFPDCPVIKSRAFFSGGRSSGCAENAGASGTYYDAVPRSLTVNNHNLSTHTDTLLLEFPKQPLWTNVYIQNHAKACVPLYWGRVQVGEKLSCSIFAVLYSLKMLVVC